MIHVALLRGINVGKAKRVAMADLRDLVASLGYANVRTLRSSGNVLFEAPRGSSAAAARAIEGGVAARIGVRTRVTVVDAADVATIVREHPFLDIATDPSRLFVTVLNDPADRARFTEIGERDWAPDAVAIGSRSIYTWCPNGALASPAFAAVAKVLGERGTARNWATVEKLADLAAQA